MKMFSRQFPIKRTNSRGHTTIIEGPNLFCQKSSFQPPQKMASFKLAKNKIHVFWCFLKEAFFFGTWDELFWQNRLGPSIIVVWPRELVRLVENCLENILIIYHMVPRKVSTGIWSPHPDFLTPQKTWKSAWFINILHSLVRIPYKKLNVSNWTSQARRKFSRRRLTIW